MKSFFQQLRLIFLALLGGQLLFCGVVYFLLQEASPAPGFDNFQFFIPAFLLVCTGLAFWINNRRLEQGRELKDPVARAENYRSTVILRLALIEGANLFAIIAALISENSSLLLNFAVGLLVFIWFRPREEELESK